MGLLRRKQQADTTIDLRDDASSAQEPKRSAVQAGVPGRCPTCDGFGYIDRIDMVNRNQTQHCLECGHVWSFSFDEDGEVIDLTDSATERSPSAYWIKS